MNEVQKWNVKVYANSAGHASRTVLEPARSGEDGDWVRYDQHVEAMERLMRQALEAISVLEEMVGSEA